MTSVLEKFIQLCRSTSLKDIQIFEHEHPDFDIVDQLESTGENGLISAAKGNNFEVLKHLLKQGSPWNAIDREGKCCGNYAMELTPYNQEMVDYITNHAVQCELLLLALKQPSNVHEQTNEKYLSENVRYTEKSLIDGEKDGVMMDWETPLMRVHASVLANGLEKRLGENSGDDEAVRVLNVGYGMGIVDECLKEEIASKLTELGKQNEIEQHIIEAHPEVLNRLKNIDHNFTVHGKRWQESIPEIIEKGVKYDCIFFDTYAEYDHDFYEFLEFLPKILNKSGSFSYFNGNCPDNIFFHGVACQIAKLKLAKLGLETDFLSVEIDVDDEKTWEEVKRRYWHRKEYFLPISSFHE